MNKFDKNFHINFLPLYGVIVFMILMAFAHEAKAEEEFIEEVVVVGAEVRNEVADVSSDFSILEIIQPATPYAIGGLGGFIGYAERGTQSVHTSVFRNGIPVNDAGAGWYDFAHDIPTGFEKIKIVDGPNSVHYGSASMGGTVLISDDLGDGLITRVGGEHSLASYSVNDMFNVTYLKANNGSVRTDNDEDDWYENKTARTSFDFAGWNLSANYTDYDYDYDNCFNDAFESVNDCLQVGEKINFSLRNDYLTFGYSSNEADYFTEDVQTWNSKAERYHLDIKETFEVGYPTAKLTIGLTANHELFQDNEDTRTSFYSSMNWFDRFDIGFRVNEEGEAIFRSGFRLENFYVQIGESYRRPSMYETFGDPWLDANPDLESEDGFGFDIGYGALSVFKYKFRQGIEYAPGYTFEYTDAEGNLVSEWTNATYVNTGAYQTQGIRFNNVYSSGIHSWNVFFGYTDSDQPRIPEFKTKVGYGIEAYNTTFNISFVGQYERGNEVFTDVPLEDIQTFDFVISRKFNRFELDFTVQDLLDREFEIVPGYGAGGRNFYLTVTYK